MEALPLSLPELPRPFNPQKEAAEACYLGPEILRNNKEQVPYNPYTSH